MNITIHEQDAERASVALKKAIEACDTCLETIRYNKALPAPDKSLSLAYHKAQKEALFTLKQAIDQALKGN